MIILLLLLTWASLRAWAAPHQEERKQLLLIMLDGFRYDYLDDMSPNDIPGFTRFLKDGVKAKWVKPIFPSISYPSWTTISTGLYPETHGVVGNYFYDPEEKDFFALFDSSATGKKKWWTSEPIWTTATNNGLRTASLFWSRADVPFEGVVPEVAQGFVRERKSAQVLRNNMDDAINKLHNGFDFILLYNSYMDTVGHNSGPDSDQRKRAVTEIDQILDDAQNKLEHLGMTDHVNVVVVSDHGMTNTAPNAVRRLEVDDYLPRDAVENIADSVAFMNIKCRPGRVDDVYTGLRRMPGVDVYKHDSIPDHLRFKHHKYIHDIVVSANIGYYLMPSRSPQQLPSRSEYVVSYGSHGYKPDEESMRSIFFAKGPMFKTGAEVAPIELVDIYQIVAHALQIPAMPHNGTWSRVRSVFMEDSPMPYTASAPVLKPVTLFAAAFWMAITSLL